MYILYIYTYLFMYMCMCIYSYIPLSISICQYIYIYIYIYRELDKGEILLIASTPLGVKDKNMYRNTTKMHLRMKAEFGH